jgi:hypothetical protein
MSVGRGQVGATAHTGEAVAGAAVVPGDRTGCSSGRFAGGC